MRNIVIYGIPSTATEQRQNDAMPRENVEVWGVNEAHRFLPEGVSISRMFQMHVRDWREADRAFTHSNGKRLPPWMNRDCFGRNKAHVEYLRTCGVPVYGQQVWADIPTSVRYPFEGVTKFVGIPLPPNGIKRLWATSSFGYMLALAVAEHMQATAHSVDFPGYGGMVRRIYMVNCELPMGTGRERLWEWPNLAYYLGLATGLGIEVVLSPAGTSLLSAPHYALDCRPHAGDADHWLLPGSPGVVEADGVYRLGTAQPEYRVKRG